MKKLASRPRRRTLTVSDLAVRYGGVSAVTVGQLHRRAPGQSVGLIGANGAGKTSTLRALMGLVPRAAGEVRFGDRDLSKVPARDMVRLGIGYVPEGRHVFAGLTVEKNLLLGAYARRWDGQTRETPRRGLRAVPGARARCAAGWPARCPAGSSRCWPSAGR